MDSSRSPTEELLGEVAFVHRLARALVRDVGQAHDVAQDALTAALQQQPLRHVRGWLAAVTKHLAARVGRDAQERPVREARAARSPVHDGEDRTAERLRLHRRLTEAVMALPEPYRTAVTLRFFDELTPRAIARRLGLPAATVRQHVHRGLALLRQQLDAEFGGRERWRGAFAALVLGRATVPFLAWLPVLVMNKALVCAALVAAVGIGWWSWPRSDVPPVMAQVAISAPSPATALAASGASVANETKVDAERTAAAVPGARDAAFVVRVVDEREQAVAGADVHRWTAAGVTANQRTDRDGRAGFAAIDGAGGVLVRADGWTPFVRELASLRGELPVTVVDGAMLEGQMLVDGVPAPAGVRLGLYTNLVLPESAPRELRKAFEWRPSCLAATTAGGAFVFRGLTAGLEVKLELPNTHWFMAEEGRMEQSSDDSDFRTRAVLPARRVLLRTTRLPGVYGRIVWADDGKPVSAPELTVVAQFADGDGSPMLCFTGNDDGTFATGFCPGSLMDNLRWRDPTRRTAITSVHVSVEAGGSDGSVSVNLDQKALAAMPIEVRLPRGAVTHFLVTDLEDRPIAGARVSARSGTLTDERGRGTFQGKRDNVLVGADGHQVQPALSHRPAAGTENDPMRFRLAPRNHLVLHVRDTAGGVAPIGFVRIKSRAGHLFCGKRFHNSFDETFGGNFGISGANARPQPDGSTEMYEWTCRTRLDANGRSELHSLEPGVPCTAEASDSCGRVVGTASFVMPVAGETVTVDVIVSGTPHTLRGRVQAQDGTPLPQATIRLSNGENETETRIQVDGSFTFTGVYGDGPFELRAAKGYVKAARTVAAAEIANDHVLVLEAGQRVTLRIVDPEDRPVPAVARAEVIPGHSMHPERLEPGEHLFTDLPSGIVTFETAFGGNRFRIAQDSAIPNAVLRVPRPARIVVGKPKDVSSTDEVAARVTRLDAAGEPFGVGIGNRSDAEAELLLPGRYRIDFYRVTWRGQGETRERVEETVAPSQQFEAKAGDLVRIQF